MAPASISSHESALEVNSEFASQWIGKQIEAFVRTGDSESEQRLRLLNAKLMRLRNAGTGT